MLLDKDGFGSLLRQITAGLAAPEPASDPEYQEIIHNCLFHTVWAANRLARGELWSAVGCVNVVLPKLLLCLVDLYVRFTQGKEYDTWYDGRFIESWTPPDILSAITGVFAPYDGVAVARGLRAALALLEELGGRLSNVRPWDPRLIRTVASRVEELCREAAAGPE